MNKVNFDDWDLSEIKYWDASYHHKSCSSDKGNISAWDVSNARVFTEEEIELYSLIGSANMHQPSKLTMLIRWIKGII